MPQQPNLGLESIAVLPFLSHIHDLAEVIAARAEAMSPEAAGDYLDRELAGLAVTAEKFAEGSETPGLAVELGFRNSAVVRERVAKFREAREATPR